MPTPFTLVGEFYEYLDTQGKKGYVHKDIRVFHVYEAENRKDGWRCTEIYFRLPTTNIDYQLYIKAHIDDVMTFIVDNNMIFQS